MDPRLPQYAGFPGMGTGKIVIERDGLIEYSHGRLVVRTRRSMVQHHASQQAFVGGHILGRLAPYPLASIGIKASRKDGNDAGCFFVLDGENIIELPVVVLRPEMATRLAVDQLHGDPDAVADLAHTAFDDI